MKNCKFSFAVKKEYLIALALAVVFGAAQMSGINFASKSLQTAVIGDYGYTSSPVNYQARNFACYPGPIQTSGTYAGTYNTYYYNYAEGYTNSGVQGNWCQAYSSRMGNPTKDANNKYIVTNASGQEDTNNVMYLRWLDHKNAAQIHENKVVFYENTLSGYGTYYTTGASSGGNTSPDPNGSGLYGNSVVHCSAGAVVVDHATTASQYKATSSSRHYLSSPTDENGLYDGSGHKWCELNGVAVNPVLGPETGKSMPDFASDKSMLFKFTFPNSSGGSADYYKYYNTWNSLGIASAGSDWVKCDYGIAGPFVEGINNHYISPYDSQTNQNKVKIPHYHCLSQSGGGYTEPVKDNVGPPAPYDTWTFLGGIMYSENTCAAGDAACGGAGTIGAPAPCSRGNYYYQTTSADYRRCLASSTPAADTFTPPAPSWAIGIPTNPRVTGTKGGFSSTESVPVAVDFAATGTGIPYGLATVTVQISQDTTFGTVWNKTYTATPTAVGSSLSGSLSTFSATGTYYWRAKVAMGNQESGWTTTLPYSSFIICSSGQTWNGTACTSATTTTTTTTLPCALSLVLNDNKTIYTKGDFVNYTYTCFPAGTRAANVTVQVVKPDGTVTTYNSGTNIDTATIGFSTSNLDAGVYTLRACLSSTCTTGVSSVSFTVNSSPTTTTNPVTVSADWKEVTWNNLGLKSYVSINAPQAVIDAAKAACVNTRMENVTWPNPSDFTIPATAGIPSCSGTSTITTPTTTPVYTAPKACSAGEVCTSGSWCSNGRQCYYPDSSFTCSANWQDACPTGTTVCSPTDTNCIEPGKYGSLSGWCSNSSECYMTDGKKYCQPYSSSGSVSCPAGTKVCSPNDPNCIEPGAYGSLEGWCKNAMDCYSADGKQKFCQQYSYSTAASTGAAGAAPVAATATMATSCPAGFKQCRPSDTNCIETGASGPASGWCAGSSKQCFLPDGKLYCAKMDESCPAGAGVCRASDTNCIEPGKYGPNGGWCGGSWNLQCYKNDGTGIFCSQLTNIGDPSAWEKAACPSGTSRCRADDKYCLELGKTGPSGSWCSAGMSYYNSDGTITCLSSEDYNKKSKTGTEIKVPEPIKEEFCIQIPVVAYDPTTLKCGWFANPCNVTKGWIKLESEKVCKDGTVVDSGNVTLDSTSLISLIEGDMKYLEGLTYQLMKAPSSATAAVSLLDKVQTTLSDLKAIRQTLPAKIAAVNIAANEKVNDIHKVVIPGIDARMQEIQPYFEFAGLKMEVRETQKNIRIEMANSDPTSEYYSKLKEAYEKFDGLLKSAETQTGQGLTQLVSAIKDTKSQIESLIGDKYKARKEQFYTRAIDDLVTFFDITTKFIEEKGIYEQKVAMTMERLSGIVADIKALAPEGKYAETDLSAISKLIDEGMQVKNPLATWLNGYGFAISSTLSIDYIMANVEATITAKVNEMFSGMSNKIQLMLDDAMQKVAVKVAEMVDQFSATVQEKVTQSVSNLTYIVDKHKEAMVAAKNNILDRIDALQTAIAQSHLRTFETDAVRTAMDTASTLNWCGTLAENVQSDISRAGLALEVGQPVNVTEFVNGINTYAAQNPEECYRTGVSSFRDTPTHEWYFGPAQYNTNRGLIRGYSDPNGNPNGSFGPANPTLRIEALAMVMRMLNLPTRDGAVSRNDIPAWGSMYYNGAFDKGIIDTKWRWNEPISRLQTAQLLYKALLASGKNYISAPVAFTSVNKYPDRRLFGNDPAVEALSDIGIFQGAGDTGNFNPGNNLLRSEFAAVNQRVEETLGIAATAQ